MDLYEYQGKELFRRVGIPVSEGRLAVSPEPVPLHHVIQETLDLMRPLAADNQAVLTGDVDGARGRFVLATNIDILFSSELCAFIAERRLDPARTGRR